AGHTAMSARSTRENAVMLRQRLASDERPRVANSARSIVEQEGTRECEQARHHARQQRLAVFETEAARMGPAIGKRRESADHQRIAIAMGEELADRGQGEQ